MARVPGRSRRWFDLLAMLSIGVVVVGAALLPAVTANSGETITIRGDVVAQGRPLAFFPVGFWSPNRGVLDTGRTDSNGGFTLDVPATVDGFAWAGAAPDDDHAVVRSGDELVVRGIVGAEPLPDVPAAIYQGGTTATGRRLAGGAAQLHFRLQPPGRIAGSSRVTGDRLTAVQVRRLDESVVQTLRVDARGRFRSAPLAPGDYGVVLLPAAPELPVVRAITVTSGSTTAVALGETVRGARISGTIATDTGPVESGVPVLLLHQDEEVVARTTASADGTYEFDGLAAGDYRVEIGLYDAEDGVPLPRPSVPIPGRISTPTPLPTGAPTPTSSPSSPALAAVAPAVRTSDAVLPTSLRLEVPTTLGEVGGDVFVEAAVAVSGTVQGAEGAPAQVVVEEAGTGRILRATTTADDGTYTIGGLERNGDYEVRAVSRPEDPSLARMGSASVVTEADETQVDVLLDRDALTLRGTVTGAASGTVTAGDETLLQRSGTIDESGGYVVQGLVPGAYPAVVTAPTRMESAPVPAVLVDGPAEEDDTVLDLQVGPGPATFTGRFISRGAGVPVLRGTASDAEGDIVRFGPRSDRGTVTIPRLEPGDYTYDADGFAGTVPARDGPWFFLPPTGSFSLTGDATTDVGPIVLRLRAR